MNFGPRFNLQLFNSLIRARNNSRLVKGIVVFLVIALAVAGAVVGVKHLISSLNQECTEHVDANGDYICDNCEAELEKPNEPGDEPGDDPAPECKQHAWSGGYTVVKAPTCTEKGSNEHTCLICGEKGELEVEALGHTSKKIDGVAPTCSTPGLSDGVECATCGEILKEQEVLLNGDHVDEDENWSCDICGAECLPENMERVNYTVNISDLAAGTRAADDIIGKFTILSGTEVRNRTKTYDGVEYQKSVKLGSTNSTIKVSVPGTGVLSFIVQNGSSGAAVQYVKVTKPDGTVMEVQIPGTDEGSPLYMVELEVTEGDWLIQRVSGTVDVYYLELSCLVEIAPENGFELVTTGKINYLVSDELDLSGLQLNATFSNGKTDGLDLANVTVDTSKVDMSISGVYTITITYKDYEPIEYSVYVYAPETIELGFDAVEKLSYNTGYGNGFYYNHSWKEVYFVGDELTTNGLTVFVIGKCGEATHKFTVTNYEISGFDSSYADYNILTISAYNISTQVEVHVTDCEPTPNENGVYQLLVDPAYEGLAGALSGPYHTFKTIQSALDYAAKIDKNAVKELYIAPGLYKEKLEIEIPNLHIIGWGNTPDEVVIEWDSLYGLVDAGGFTHTTDSTQTVAVRESAYNVTIENITISNYWNSQERMDAAGLDIERGLALLVQGDRFVMKNSRLLGIQDTLELFTGRQYFENVFISGYTDFIFGTNNTTLFKNCTIHVIDTVKDDKGTAGYITAFKGSNKGANDAIVYGAIFDNCKFTADEGVTLGCTAIGRTWGAYAAVAVINSDLGGHISVKGYDSSNNKNLRYISMNGIHPTDATVQFVEFGNRGAGALTEAVAGMKMLTAEEAALYLDLATIFGTTNGKVSYLDPWDPTSGEVQVDDRTYYYFNGTEGSTGTSYTYTENVQGTTLEWNGLLIDATTGKLTARGSDAQFNAGAKIIFNVEAGTLVTVISYPGYGYYTINGVGHNANDTFSMYFAEATEVVIEATATSYIYQIIINPDEEAPAAPTLNELKVEGLNKNYTVGDELSLEGVVVKAYYSDYSVVVLSDYTVDSSAVVNSAAGEYAVVFTYGGKSVSVTVTFEAADADPRKDLTINFGSNGNYKELIDISGASIRDNGGDNSQISSGSFSIVVYQGATVLIHGYPGYTSYSINGGDSITEEYYTYEVTEDGALVIEATDSNNYLYSIEIKYPSEPVKESFTLSFGSEGSYKDAPDVVDLSNIQIGDNGSDNSQVKNGYLTITVFAGAKVTINGYPGYTSYTLGDGTTTTEEITASTYEYVAAADCVITITPVSGNNYFYSISVVYAAEEPEREEVSYVLDATADLPAMAQGEKADGDTEAAGSEGFFTIHYSAKNKVDGSSKTFDDGYKGTQRLNFGGSTSIGSTTKNAVEFTVTDAATVTVWWVSGGDGRRMAIYDEAGNIVLSAGADSVKNSLYMSTFELEAGGTYYIGVPDGSNYLFKLQVDTTK